MRQDSLFPAGRHMDTPRSPPGVAVFFLLSAVGIRFQTAAVRCQVVIVEFLSCAGWQPTIIIRISPLHPTWYKLIRKHYFYKAVERYPRSRFATFCFSPYWIATHRTYSLASGPINCGSHIFLLSPFSPPRCPPGVAVCPDLACYTPRCSLSYLPDDVILV